MKRKKEPTFEENIQKQIEQSAETSEEAMAKAIDILSKTKYPQQLTELNEKEIRLLTSLETQAELFHSDLLKDIADNFKYLRVSTHRKGRQEILKVGAAAKEQHDATSRWRKLFTLGRGSI